MELGFTKFDAQLYVTYDAEASKALGKDYWRVTKAFRYYVGSPDSQTWVSVPEGYLTDGASVPRALWAVIPPWGSYGQAAVVHDILCEYMSWTHQGVPQAITRAQADAVMDEAMTVLGVSTADHAMIMDGLALYRLVDNPTVPKTNPAKRALEARQFATA